MSYPHFRGSVALILAICFASTLIAKTLSSSTTQALNALQNSFQALTAKTVLNDITLTGTAQWIAGSDDETGTATYKALTGVSRLDLALSNGTRSEIRSNTASGPSGNWIGPDGVSHAMANHNLVADAALTCRYAASRFE